MAKKQFKAESKRLLDLMINSIYTHQEIFLREIISNASDAIDKLAYISLTDQNVGVDRDGFRICVVPDPEAKTITVSDNGIGMSKEEMENNLGTIAKSGSKAFKESMEKSETVDIIGQFGVGFYSAFMVAKKITVVSKKYGEDSAWKWESSGVDGYTVEACEKDSVGTDVIMLLKEDTEDDNFSKFLQPWQLQQLIKKYSDYIRYPIHMDMERSRIKEGTEENPEYESYTEDTVINSMIPIWQRNKSEVTEEEYQAFYKEHFHDYENPLTTIHVSVEGAVTYKALLFIPASLPYDYNAREFKKNLQLYSSGVMIMENCEDLLPNHFGFIKGIVDSQDLSLNISREMLQHNRQLKVIAKNLDKKVRQELERILRDDREKYESLWNIFGRSLKYGLLDQYGANKDDLKNLLLYWSDKEQKPISLNEYTEAMGTDQQYIYYASGDNRGKLSGLPQMERIRSRGYDVLLFTDTVDDFVVQTLRTYNEKEFRSIQAEDLGLDSEEEKKAMEEQQASEQELLAFMKETLGDKVSEIVLSNNLGSHAVAVRPGEGISFEMEKYFARVNPEMPMKADRILELNPAHPVFTALKTAKATDLDRAACYTELLYNQAMLLADMPLDEPIKFVDSICSLMK